MALTKQDKAFIIGVIEGSHLSLKEEMRQKFQDNDEKFLSIRIEMKEMEKRLCERIEKAIFESEKRFIEATGEIMYDYKTRLRKLETNLLK